MSEILNPLPVSVTALGARNKKREQKPKEPVELAAKLAASATKARMESVLWFAFSSLFYFDPSLVASEGDFSSSTERDAATPVEPLGYDCMPELVLNEAMRPMVATVTEQGGVFQEVHPVLALALDIERGFNMLNYDERLALTHHYGLKRSLEEVGDTMRYEVQTVRRILNRALAKLAPFVVSLAAMSELPAFVAESGAEEQPLTPGATPYSGQSANAPGSRVAKKRAVTTTGRLIDAAASARERRKLAPLAQRENQLKQHAITNYQIIEGERFWERDSEREERAANPAEHTRLSYAERLSQALFNYLRRVPGEAPDHERTGDASELFYLKGYGYRREVLLAKLYEMATNSTYQAERIVRKLFSPQVTSGANLVQFAGEFGFSYGHVVRVKRDFLVRLVDWTTDGDIAIRYAASKLPLPIPANTHSEKSLAVVTEQEAVA